MDDLSNLGDLSDELSAKVAQMQALLAEETSNVGSVVLDADTLARLEESYNSSSDEEEDEKTRVSAATEPKPKPKKKPKSPKAKAKTSPATGITATKRGRPKGAREDADRSRNALVGAKREIPARRVA